MSRRIRASHPFVAKIEAQTGKTAVSIHSINRGYTPAKRVVITFSDSSSLFAKIGTTPMTVAELYKEKRVYENLFGSFMPKYYGFIDGEKPMLLIEDLSQAYWPPPWRTGDVAKIAAALKNIWSHTIPNLPFLKDNQLLIDGWHQVAIDPVPFLNLGLVTAEWLEQSLPVLLSINAEKTVDGSSLLHLDIRSDNLCILDARVVLVDWNHAHIGNEKFDLGAWLPSLTAEGGPSPESILPQAGDIAGIISGFFASRAGLPPIKDAPFVRQVQLQQLKTALPWAIRALDLPPLHNQKVRD